MNEKKLKHLEFIQNNIIRMSRNSFLIKGWAITLVSAVFAITTKDQNKDYIYLVYIITPLFWYLNAFFLLQERRFRRLYDDVRVKTERDIDFSMNTSSYKDGNCSWYSPFYSKSIAPLYAILIMVMLLVMFVMK